MKERNVSPGPLLCTLLWALAMPGAIQGSPPQEGRSSTGNYALVEEVVLPSNIESIRSGEGGIWVSTRKGVFTFGSPVGKEKCGSLYFGQDQGLPSEEVYMVYRDSDDNMLAGTRNGAAILWNPPACPSIYDEFYEFEIKGKRVYAISDDQNGDYWFGTDEGLFKWTPYGDPAAPQGKFQFDRNSFIHRDGDDLWVATGRALWKLMPSGSFAEIHEADELPRNDALLATYSIQEGIFEESRVIGWSPGDFREVRCYHLQRGGNREAVVFWFATRRNVSNWRAGDPKLLVELEKRPSDVEHIAVDGSGGLWLGAGRQIISYRKQ